MTGYALGLILAILLVLDAIAIDVARRRGYAEGYKVGFAIGERQRRRDEEAP